MKRSHETSTIMPDDPLQVTYLPLASVSVLVAANTQHALAGPVTDMEQAGHSMMLRAADLYLTPRQKAERTAQRDIALDIAATALRVVAQCDAELEDVSDDDLESEAF